MDDPAGSSRLLSPREVRFVLKRSVQLQQLEAQAVAAREGTVDGDLSLAELAEVADEVGLDPYYVERAASELSGSTLEIDWAALLGGPFTTRIEETVEADLPDAALEDLVPEIETAAATKGKATLGASSLVWRSDRSEGLIRLLVTLRARGGRTRIGIEERMGGLAGLLHGTIVGGVGAGVGFGVGLPVGLGALGSVSFAILFPAAFLVGSFAVTRFVLAQVGRSRRRTLLRLLEQLAERLGE